MRSIFYTICMIVIWTVNLFNETGLGKQYYTTEIFAVVILVLAILYLMSQTVKEGDLLIQPRFFYTILPFALVYLFSSYINGRFMVDIKAFWVYPLMYILSRTRPSHTALRMTAICYAALGLFILVLFNYTDIFKGWNSNSIAMIGLFSFLVFTIPFYGMREWRSFIVMPLIGAAYVILLLPTESRSCILVIVIQLLLILRILPGEKLFSSKKGLIILLLVPLGVSIFVSLFSIFGDMSGLTQWSYETFNKPLFNERDQIWRYGFERLWKSPIWGSGNMETGFWHNSAIACLTSLGIPGFVLWVRLFYLILREGQPYTDDICVIGCLAAFLVLYCQQSVELGIIATRPNVLPYMILGVMLGRVKVVKEERKRVQS